MQTPQQMQAALEDAAAVLGVLIEGDEITTTDLARAMRTLLYVLASQAEAVGAMVKQRKQQQGPGSIYVPGGPLRPTR